MVEFKIRPKNGKGRHVVHWCVYAVNQLTDEWIFIKAFLTKQRALDYLDTLKDFIRKGNYSCLTLRA